MVNPRESEESLDTFQSESFLSNGFMLMRVSRPEMESVSEIIK